MRMMRILGVILAFGIATALGGSALAEGPPITQVVVIDTNGDTDKLLADAKSNEKIFARLGIQAKRRYMQATLAGSTSGSVAVVIEYPSLVALAAAQEKLSDDAEWQKYIDRINDGGMTVESNAVWMEITP
jgi:hypothetical protein